MTDPRRMIETEGAWMRQLLLANHGDRAPTRVHAKVERLLGTAWVGTEVVEVAKEASTQSGALQAAQLAPAVPLTQAASISAASLKAAGASSAATLQATTTPVGVALGSSTSGLALPASGVASQAAGASLSVAVKGGVAKLAANVVSWSLGTKLLVGASILSAGGVASLAAWDDPELATPAVADTAPASPRGASVGPVSSPRRDPSASSEARESANPQERTEVDRGPTALTETPRLQTKEVTDLPLVEAEERPKETARVHRARPKLRTSTLQEELRYIRVARAALKAGNPESARRALDAYRRKFPAGKLKPEAQGLRRIVARQKTSK